MGGVGGPWDELFDLGEKIAEGKKSARKKSGASEPAGTARGKGRKPPTPRCKLPSENLCSMFYRYFVS